MLVTQVSASPLKNQINRYKKHFIIKEVATNNVAVFYEERSETSNPQAQDHHKKPHSSLIITSGDQVNIYYQQHNLFI